MFASLALLFWRIYTFLTGAKNVRKFSITLEWKRGTRMLNLNTETTVGELKRQASRLTKINVNRLNLVWVNQMQRLDISRDNEKIETLGLGGDDDKLFAVEGSPGTPLNDEDLGNYLKMEVEKIIRALILEKDRIGGSGDATSKYYAFFYQTHPSARPHLIRRRIL